jgi:pyruvate formate lyase activating enzyme
MLIGGIQKTTFLDYPGKVATLLFTVGCNLRCQFCYNKEFVLPAEIKKNMSNYINQQAIYNFLETRKWLIDGVVICGGEPTLQKDLYECIYTIKQMGFLVKLDTNGRDPDMIARLIEEKLIDYIAMDIKDCPYTWWKLVGSNEKFATYQKTANIILASNIDYEFRTTVIKWYHTTTKIIEIAKSIQGAKKYALQNFQIPKTLLNPYFKGKSFSVIELQDLKEIIEPYVWICEIRP